VYPKLGKRAHLYSKRETQERDGESAFRCCAVIGLRAAIFPLTVLVCVWHKSTMPQGGLGCKKYSFSTEIELTNCRHGRVRIGTALYGFRLTGYGFRPVRLRLAWGVLHHLLDYPATEIPLQVSQVQVRFGKLLYLFKF